MAVVVTYEVGGAAIFMEVIELKHDFDTVAGWNEMMDGLSHGNKNKNIVILYTHVLRG